MKKLFKKIGDISHLFGKFSAFLCLAGSCVCIAWSFRIFSHTGNDPSALLDRSLEFFTLELGMLLGKTISDKKKKKASDSDAEGDTYHE